MAVTRKDTAALTGARPGPEGQPVVDEPRPTPRSRRDRGRGHRGEEPKAHERRLPFISEGLRQDLEMHGKATDPVTGAVLVLDRETGHITVALKT
jgi:hypothetical protein